MLRTARRVLVLPHVEVGFSDTVVRHLLKIFTDLDGAERYPVASMRLVEMSSGVEDHVPICPMLFDIARQECLREILVVEGLAGLFLDVWPRRVHDLPRMGG